jgi:hypothetical protein
MSGKKFSDTAVSEVPGDLRQAGEDLRETVETSGEQTHPPERAETAGRRPGRPGTWVAAGAGVLAGIAAVTTLWWRRMATHRPRNRAQRAWREVRTRVRKATR